MTSQSAPASAPPVALRGGVTDREETAHVRAEPSPTCTHHWLIETPQGATSKGRCRKCNAKRTFSNAYTGWSGHGGAEFYAPLEPSSIARWLP